MWAEEISETEDITCFDQACVVFSNLNDNLFITIILQCHYLEVDGFELILIALIMQDLFMLKLS